MGDNEIMLVIARSLGFAIGFATFILGFISILTSNFNWCPNATYNMCLGPSLRWNNGGPGQDFVADANRGALNSAVADGWRSIFT
jgi:hypothetical protein